MPDYKTVTGTHKGAKTETNVRVPVTALGQRYAAPEGRHSQQSHLRAQARAAEGGHASESELHAADRADLQAGLDKKAHQIKNQQEQNNRSTAVKKKPQEPATEAAV